MKTDRSVKLKQNQTQSGISYNNCSSSEIKPNPKSQLTEYRIPN